MDWIGYMASPPKEKQVPTSGKAPSPFVSSPLRFSPSSEPPSALKNLFSSIAASMPSLKRDLAISESEKSPQQFVQECFFGAITLTVLLEAILASSLYFATVNYGFELLTSAILLLAGLPVFFYLAFQFNLYQPHVSSIRRGKKIDQEIVFAGRHLLIGLRSGMTLFDAMLGISQDYGQVSREFNKVVEKITLGVPATAAIHEVADHCPSAYMRRLLLQMANSLTSGSDLADSLESVLNQLAKEQVIQLKAYGQKLNPLVMFYMLFGVIIPSLGVAFLIIIFSLVGSNIGISGTGLLAGVFGIVLITQLMFLSVVENSRPSFDL